MKILMILISMVLTGCYSSSSEVSAYSHSPRTQKSCTEEAKLCPDGKTTVVRTPNNHCEFDHCP